MDDAAKLLLGNLRITNVGASEIKIRQLLDKLGVVLPTDYIEFLRFMDGGAGPIGDTGYVNFWTSDEIPVYAMGDDVTQFAPGLILIGSNGGNTCFGIDARSGDPSLMDYVEMDYITMDWDEVFYRCKHFIDLLKHMASR